MLTLILCADNGYFSVFVALIEKYEPNFLDFILLRKAVNSLLNQDSVIVFFTFWILIYFSEYIIWLNKGKREKQIKLITQVGIYSWVSTHFYH